jgi:hypothetical protein
VARARVVILATSITLEYCSSTTYYKYKANENSNSEKAGSNVSDIQYSSTVRYIN